MLQAFREGLVLKGVNAPDQSQLQLPNGYSLVVGVPTILQKDRLLGGEEVAVPIEPHIFIATQLQIGTRQPLNDVVVLVAHGERNKENKWVFANGQEVDSTVIEFNKFAEKNGLRKIEAVLVCNTSGADHNQSSPDLLREGIIFPNGSLYIHMNLNRDGLRIIASTTQGSSFSLPK